MDNKELNDNKLTSLPKNIKIVSIILTVYAILSGIQFLNLRYIKSGIEGINPFSILFSILLASIILIFIRYLKKGINFFRILFIILGIIFVLGVPYLFFQTQNTNILRLIISLIQVLCIVISDILLLKKESNKWFKEIKESKKTASN